MAEVKRGERSIITSGFLLRNIERSKAAFREVFRTEGYVTNTDIHCPLCGTRRKHANNGSAMMIIRHLNKEHVLKNKFNTERDITKIRLLQEKLKIRRSPLLKST